MRYLLLLSILMLVIGSCEKQQESKKWKCVKTSIIDTGHEKFDTVVIVLYPPKITSDQVVDYQRERKGFSYSIMNGDTVQATEYTCNCDPMVCN